MGFIVCKDNAKDHGLEQSSKFCQQYLYESHLDSQVFQSIQISIKFSYCLFYLDFIFWELKAVLQLCGFYRYKFLEKNEEILLFKVQFESFDLRS
jgi:hypothetical protein